MDQIYLQNVLLMSQELVTMDGVCHMPDGVWLVHVTLRIQSSLT